ncbi:GH36-type glycosyl hydrolase domain-containing protein [Paenibacillus aurantiacus]|uniref:GH36-type glycosyl hydrolase domain-containing protein n=1 Tax=Paenibacillus aurantiacus TaxID=1936118 RepID=A0ABV5KPT3_9BACL
MTSIETSVWAVEAGGLRFTFHPSGDLHEAMAHDGIMLNQVLASPVDGAMNNVYLRVYDEDGNVSTAYPLIGIRSRSEVALGKRGVQWRGNAGGIDYAVSFLLSDKGVWFWDVSIAAASGASVMADVVYGQDIGLAAPGAVRSNEAYLSQYLDHSAYEDAKRGWIVCTRQNQPQDGRFPYLQQGCLSYATAYATDGFQFFGLSFKNTHRPEALTRGDLPSENYQYEFAYTALQSRRMNAAEGGRAVFYGLFEADHPEAVREAGFEERLLAAWEEVRSTPPVFERFEPVPARAADIGEPLRSRPLTREEIERRYPHRLQEEWDHGELLSFFTPTYEHVVLKAKELLTERPHGHILMSGAPDRAGAEMLTSTAYMYGIFHSQLVVGNTSFNKLIGNARNALNVLHVSGMRLYAEVDGRFRLLAMPSLFEMGFNYARWLYVLDDDVVEVTSYTAADSPIAALAVRSEQDRPRRYVLTSQMTMYEREYETPYKTERQGESYVFRAAAGTPAADVYPALGYRLTLEGAEATAADERRLVPALSPGSAPLFVLETEASSTWQLRIEGRLEGLASATAAIPALEQAAEQYRLGMAELMNGFHLAHPGQHAIGVIERLNILAWWYTHNMRVHFAVPHGLEQYGGAAWGTRDVCQGPAEYFLAMQHYDAVGDILRIVYSHQYAEDGGWPQWFMFDRYHRIQQEESHGDIIVWPLKLLGDYIAATGDLAMLEETLPYTSRASHEFTESRESLLAHVKKQVAYIRSHFLHDTHLSAYGDGDWDDTLQPASASLRAYMASSWTVALTYQTLRVFGRLLAADEQSPERAAFGREAESLAAGIRRDFGTYMEPDAVIPGFLYMEQRDRPQKLLHPDDAGTGIRYRLLPMTRSMIAELLTPAQAEQHYELIKRELHFPDGVRLMDRPAAYDGGVSKRFKRAEQAANFGREIGLQYVHAHIRFIEAMAKLGKADEAWRALHVINPVGLRESVPNAELRQSNAYFSSSDGRFANRYEAAARFDELRSGSVGVKGGWRIYSSGPGIYMNQLISNVLGIRLTADELVLDPVLPNELDGMTVRFAIGGRPVRITYRLSGSYVSGVAFNGTAIEARRLTGTYRDTGACIALEQLDPLWRREGELLNELLIQA